MHGLSGARLSTDGRVKDVRADHVARYRWAAELIRGHVIDAGCNSGYGSAILADAGLTVTGIDNWKPGLDYARRHWDRPGIFWMTADLEQIVKLPPAAAVVAFEVIEHLNDPTPLLREARQVAGRLFASVPNQAVWPHERRLYPVHKRHYTRAEFEELLIGSGWREIEWWGQLGGESQVEREVNGRTLVVACR